MKFEFSTFKTVASCLLMVAHCSLSAQETFKINAETTSKESSKNSNVFLVEYKEIEYYPLVDAKVPTSFYQSFLDDKEELRKEYSEAIANKKIYEDRKNKKHKIIQLINEYLSDSRNNKLLDDADKLSLELKLKFIIEDRSSQYKDWGMKPKKTLFIKNDNGKYASKAMLKEYLESMNIEINRCNYKTSYQEEKFTASEKEVQEFSDDEKYEIGKIKSTTLAKRKAYIKSDKKINDFSEIYGTYKEMAKAKSIDDFESRSEILKEIVIDTAYYDESEYKIAVDRLVKNVDTGKLYYFPHKTVSEILYTNVQKIISDFLTSIGYKPYKQDNNLYVKTKAYRVLCNMSTYTVLKKDKDYMNKIDAWYDQRQVIRKQIIPIIPQLSNYVRLYRIQRNRMSKSDISAWTAITKSANLLNKKEVDLTDKLWGLVELQDASKEYAKYSSDFINYLGASTGVLRL